MGQVSPGFDQSFLEDSHQRRFQYLRLSITETCNFRCAYCLPEGSSRCSGPSDLSVQEITNLVYSLAELGISKVRLTGGEPTTRGDFLDIVRAVSSVPGIRSVALTTNGYRLKRLVPEMKEAGLTAINVSVDSLRAARFHQITGQDRLQEVLEGIDRALELGFSRLKVNVVLLRGINDDELDDFIAWTARAPISVRFIELMETGGNGEYFKSHHTSADSVHQILREGNWRPVTSSCGSGPAVEWQHPHYPGKVGIIAPYSRDFCSGCNRLRVTSLGALRLCLFGESDYSLRDLMQCAQQRKELKDTVLQLLQRKQASHLLHEGKFGNVRDLARIGG